MRSEKPSTLYRLVRTLFFGLINKEFLIFLSFLCLSGAFWLLMTLNETYEREIMIPVHLDGVPNKVVVTSNPDDTLRVTIRDRGYFLWAYLYGDHIKTVNIPYNIYNKGNGKGIAQSGDLQKLIYQMLFNSSRIVGMKPDHFSFTYNYGERKMISVALDGKVIPGKSYYLAKVKFEPEQVYVYASREKLDSIRQIFTEKILIHNLSDTVVETVNLKKIPGVKFVPSKVKVSFYPDILTEESVEVPVSAINMPPGKVLRTFPPRVKVVFTTGASSFRAMRAENFKVVADYFDLAGEPSDKCKLRLEAAPQGVRNARPQPEQVDYLIEEQ